MANQPISNYAYETAEEALLKAQELGCSGYRSYVVDDQTVYLPCSETTEFEQATQFTIIQGHIVGRGDEVFGGNLVGRQLTDKDAVGGDPFFTMGNFTINSTLTVGGKEKPFVLPAVGKSNTAESVTNKSGSAALTQTEYVAEAKTVEFNYDKTNFERFTLYGSLSDKISFAIIDITEKYPAALAFNVGTSATPTILNHEANYTESTSSFFLDSSLLFNPFDIYYIADGEDLDDNDFNNPVRNFTKYFEKYDLIFNGIRYDILSYTAPETTTAGYLELVIDGFPFANLVDDTDTYNDIVYIVPKIEEANALMISMSDMAQYLLNTTISNTRYIAEFKTPVEDINGNVIIKRKRLEFPTYDKYNIDLNSDAFDQYLSKLSTIASDFDTYKTNLISRFLTTDSLKEFDTDDRKIDIILKSYGKSYDVIKKLIDSLAFMTNVSYDSIENVPDVLLKNFARTLGWKTYEIEDEDTIAQSLFDLSEDPETEGDITPGELDIQLWRRLLMNTAYLFKSKGTRKAIDTIMRLVGIPELVYEINEHVYVAQDKLDYGYYVSKFLSNVNNYPITSDGYPSVPTNLVYQEFGGYPLEDDLNLGAYDYGKNYIKAYEKFGNYYAFDIYRTIDNKKCWVSTETPEYREDTNLLNDTKYYLKDSRLVVNVKNLDVYLALDRVIDSRIYLLFAENNIAIDSTLDSSYSGIVHASGLTFNNFVRECYLNFINVTNRKTIQTYPTLTKIYYDYIEKSNELGLNYADYDISLQFLQKYDTYWVDLIRQFTPATAILSAGKKIANSQFNDNKHKYLHGQTYKPIIGEIDTDVDWLGTDGSEFQSYALAPVIDGQTEPIANTGTVGDNVLGEFEGFDFVGSLKGRNFGYLNRAEHFAANYYNFYEFCNFTEGVMSDSGGTSNDGFFEIYPPKYESEYDNFTIFITNSGGSVGQIFSGQTDTGLSHAIQHADISYEKAYDGSTSLKAELVADVPSYASIDLLNFNNISLAANTDYKVEIMVYIDTALENYKSSVNGQYMFSLIIEADDTQSTILNKVSSGITKNYYEVSQNWVNVVTTFTTGDLTGTTYTFTVKLQAHAGSTSFEDLDGVDIYFDNFTINKYAEGFADAYEAVDITYICPPPLPHVCYYNNSPKTISASEFNNSMVNGSVSAYTPSMVTTTLDIVDGDIMVASGDTSTGVTSTFVINSGTSEYGVSYSYNYFVEIEYSNTYTHTYAETDIISEHVNPILEIIIGNKPSGISRNYTQTTGLIKIELVPTTYSNLGGDDTKKIRFYTNMGPGDAQLSENYYSYIDCTVKIPETPTNVTRNTDGQVRIISHKIYKTPSYGNDSVGTSTTTDFKLDWYKNQFMIKQPPYYGLSIDTGTTRPTDTVLGSSGEWYVPYRKDDNSVPTGSTITTGEINELGDRSLTDPFMHMPTILDQSFVVTPNDDTLSINLTSSLDLYHVFGPSSGGVGGTYNTYHEDYNANSVSNQEIDGKIYMSDSVSINFDGMYATRGTIQAGGPGPIYNMSSKPSITSVLPNDVLCEQGVNTFLAIAQPTETFSTSTSTIDLINNGTHTYYQPNEYRLFRYKAELIFDSDDYNNQDITIKLVNGLGLVLGEQIGTISSSNNPAFADTSDRTITFDETVFMSPNDQAFWVVESHDANCYVKAYDEIEINPQEEYDGKAYVHITPAAYQGSVDRPKIIDKFGYGLPNMFLAAGDGAYYSGIYESTAITGDTSGNEYYIDAEDFTSKFRYAKDYYYDTIIFETTGTYTRNVLDSGCTITGTEDIILGKKIFEYLPFSNERNGDSTTYNYGGEDQYRQYDEHDVNSSVELINYSDAFDVAAFGKFDTDNLLFDNRDMIDILPEIFEVLNGTSTDISDINPLLYAYSIVGPFGIDGMNTETIYPFGIFDFDRFDNSLDISAADNNLLYSRELAEYGPDYPVFGSLTGITGLIYQCKEFFTGDVAVLTGSTYTYYAKNTGNTQTIDDWDIITNGNQYMLKNQYAHYRAPKQPVTEAFLINKELTDISGNTITIMDRSNQATSYHSPVKNVLNYTYEEYNTSVYYPTGLSNTYVKYRKRSHFWVYSSTVNHLTNEINQYMTSFKIKDNLTVGEKVNVTSMKSTAARHIDMDTLNDFEYVSNPVKFEPITYGQTEFTQTGGDVIMNYTVDKDPAGYPKTGEFVGRLTMYDICGNIATAFLRLFILNESELVPELLGVTEAIETVSTEVITLPVQTGSTTTLPGKVNISLNNIGDPVNPINLIVKENGTTIFTSSTFISSTMVTFTIGNDIEITYSVSNASRDTEVTTVDVYNERSWDLVKPFFGNGTFENTTGHFSVKINTTTSSNGGGNTLV